MKKIAIATCMLLGFASTVQAGGDPAIGRDKSAMCGACHGADGNSAVPTFPKLAGQSEAYLTKQTMNFKSGARKDPVMSGQAAALEDGDIPHLAAYFASQKPVPGAASDADLAAQGQRIYLGGVTAKGVSACAACHGPSGNGNPAAEFPGLSGQHSTYTVTQLQRFKSGERENDMMQGAVANMSEDEMKAVAEYIAGLH
jgi:cytochrome c553